MTLKNSYSLGVGFVPQNLFKREGWNVLKWEKCKDKDFL